MSALQNARVETRAIDERREYFLSDDLLDVTTWRAEPRPFQKRRADPKSSAHEMVERNAADRDVPAMIGGAELDPMVSAQSRERLDLEDGDLPPLFRSIGVKTPP
jgi:hypothetical protein